METLLKSVPAERQASRAASTQSYRQRLSMILGDGRNWEYTGEAIDLQAPVGLCACGHQGLRYQFTIKERGTGKTVKVGSTCIEHYQDANPDMVASIGRALERFQNQISDHKRKTAELLRQEEIEKLLTLHTERAYQLDSILAQGAEMRTTRDIFNRPLTCYVQTRRVTRAVWNYWHLPDVSARMIANRKERYPKRWKAYKSQAAFAKKIREEITTIETLLAGKLFE